MKIKTAFCFLISFLLITGLQAQFRTGFKAGANFSRFTEDVDPFAPNSLYHEDYMGFKKHIRVGPTGGFFAEYNTGGRASLGGELLFSSKGARYRIRNRDVILVDGEGDESKAFDTYTYKIDYFEVPVYVQLNVSYSNNTAFDLYGGIAPAFAMNKKRIYRYYDIVGIAAPGDERKKTKEFENVRAINMFPVAGLKIGGRNGFFDLRLSYPLFPVMNYTTGNTSDNFNTRMWTLSLAGGFYFK